jgi:hypothetical protein
MVNGPDSCQGISTAQTMNHEAYYSTTNIPTAVMLTKVTRYQLSGVSLYLLISRLWTSSWLMILSMWESLLSSRDTPLPFEADEPPAAPVWLPGTALYVGLDTSSTSFKLLLHCLQIS